MRRVKNAPPDDPDALAFHIEERNPLQPPFFGLIRKVQKPRLSICDGSLGESGDASARRPDFIGARLGKPQKIAEETALTQQVMHHDFADCHGFFMRAPQEFAVVEGGPG